MSRLGPRVWVGLRPGWGASATHKLLPHVGSRGAAATPRSHVRLQETEGLGAPGQTPIRKGGLCRAGACDSQSHQGLKEGAGLCPAESFRFTRWPSDRNYMCAAPKSGSTGRTVGVLPAARPARLFPAGSLCLRGVGRRTAAHECHLPTRAGGCSLPAHRGFALF